MGALITGVRIIKTQMHDPCVSQQKPLISSIINFISLHGFHHLELSQRDELVAKIGSRRRTACSSFLPTVDTPGVSPPTEYNLAVADVCFISHTFILIAAHKGVLYVSNKMDRAVSRGDEPLSVR